MKIYLDDIRMPPSNEGWAITRGVWETIRHLQTCKIDVLSLDHDLGACDDCMRKAGVSNADEWLEKHNYMSMPHCKHVGTGYDVLTWIEERVHTDPGFQVPEILIHTANPATRERMEQAKQTIYKHIGREE